MSPVPRFHLAFPVHDLEAARAFYAGILGCATGRESDRWIDFDFEGHQITAHLCRENGAGEFNPVDGDRVPVRHFGLILPRAAWEALAARLAEAGVECIIEPRVRLRGRPGEQATMFVRDPSGNALEFKSFAEEAAIFARDPGVE
ncbi:MAG: VOC family protein [Gammaproteobacteria bacterium]